MDGIIQCVTVCVWLLSLDGRPSLFNADYILLGNLVSSIQHSPHFPSILATPSSVRLPNGQKWCFSGPCPWFSSFCRLIQGVLICCHNYYCMVWLLPNLLSKDFFVPLLGGHLHLDIQQDPCSIYLTPNFRRPSWFPVSGLNSFLELPGHSVHSWNLSSFYQVWYSNSLFTWFTCLFFSWN